MKRFPAILILTILLVNTAGFYMYYAVQLRQIRSEMRQALKLLPEDQLEILRFTTQEFREARVDEHEVKVHGKMYDMARIKVTGDSVTIYALHDEKEDDLLALLEEIISKPLSDKHSIPEPVIGFIALIFIRPDDVVSLFCSSRDLSLTTYLFSVQTDTPILESPPPREV